MKLGLPYVHSMGLSYYGVTVIMLLLSGFSIYSRAVGATTAGPGMAVTVLTLQKD